MPEAKTKEELLAWLRERLEEQGAPTSDDFMAQLEKKLDEQLGSKPGPGDEVFRKKAQVIGSLVSGMLALFSELGAGLDESILAMRLMRNFALKNFSSASVERIAQLEKNVDDSGEMLVVGIGEALAERGGCDCPRCRAKRKEQAGLAPDGSPWKH